MRKIRKLSELVLVHNDPNYPKYFYQNKVYLVNVIEGDRAELYMEIEYDAQSIAEIKEMIAERNAK